MAAKICAKLSVKSVFGVIKTLPVEISTVDENGAVQKKTVLRAEKQNIMRIFGKVSSIKKVVTTFGESLAFVGAFRATNLQTGEMSQSTKAFLPPVVAGLIGAAVEENGEGAAIEFALDIGVVPCNNAHGYEYTVTPLIEMSESDPLAALEARLTPLALAAPKNDPEPETKADEPTKPTSKKK